MKRLLPVLMGFALLLLSSTEGWNAEPDKEQLCLAGTKHSHSPVLGKCSDAYESKNYETARREWEPLAKDGNSSAQFNLGQMYRLGQGVPQNDETAVKWTRLAAEQGNAFAQYNLGHMYRLGQGVPQNDETAVKWFRTALKWIRPAAEQGDVIAQSLLGVMYHKGQGVPQNEKTAVKWTRLAAEQGNTDAQNNLGSMYANGRGVPQNDETAVKWFRLAAEQGDAIAQYRLGLMYDIGHGVPQNDKTAVKWYTLAAEQGDAPAQYNLGSMYERGEGVPQDYKTALKWYRLHAEQGGAPAQSNLDRLQKKIVQLEKDKKLSPTVTAKKSPTKGSSLPPCPQSGVWNNCFGTSTTYDGGKYVGEFKDDKFNGQGTETRANGNKYVGQFKGGNWHGRGTYTYADGRVREGIWENNKFLYAKKPSPTVIAKKSPTPSSSKNEKELEKLRKEIARLKKEKKPKPKPSPKPSGTSGSGFFISKKGHVITNQHIVSKCKEVTVGDNSKKQVTATVLETDRSNDLALLRISNMQMASVETKSLIRKLGIKVVPLATDGLMRFEDVELGERVLVAGYPYGEVFSNTIKVTGGMVSADRGLGDDTGQFQIDAAVQPGNSGGPIYDENGNIVGVVVSQLNKMKFAKATGSIPENVNFGIKASTVRQFLNASGLPTKWSKRSKSMSTRELAKIAKSQTVMVMCHR